jgi:hypothetical protein
MSELSSLSDLISEKDVYEKYRHIFADRELLEARKAGELEFYKLRMGIHYTESQLIAYLEKRKQKPCQNRPLAEPESESSNEPGSSKTSGSGKRPALRTITATGTREKELDDELVARALERQT